MSDDLGFILPLQSCVCCILQLKAFLINLQQNFPYFPLKCSLEEQSSKSTAVSETMEQQCNVLWNHSTNQERGMLTLCL